MSSSAEESFSLSDMVSQLASKLPLSVEVLQGYYGADSLLSEGDRYTIHCVMRTEVVKTCGVSSKAVNVPLNSAFRFGITYAGSLDYFEGTSFSSVGEIIAAETLPTVISVVSAPTSQSRSGPLLEKNEILAVVGSGPQEKTLVVYSLSTKSTKVLSSGIVAKFSTKPSLVQLFLHEIVQYLPDVFPCQAILFEPNGALTKASSRRAVESFLESSIVLSECHTEVSLIATKYSSHLADEATYVQPRKRLLEIPVDGDMSQVKVKIITSTDTNLERETKDIVSNFHLFPVKSLRECKGPLAKAQKVFRDTVQGGRERTQGTTFESSLGTTSSFPADTVRKTVSSPTPVYEALGGENSATLYEATPEPVVELISPLTSVAASVPPPVPRRNPTIKASSSDGLPSRTGGIPPRPKPPLKPKVPAKTSFNGYALNSRRRSDSAARPAAAVSMPLLGRSKESRSKSFVMLDEDESRRYLQGDTFYQALDPTIPIPTEDGMYMGLEHTDLDAPPLEAHGGMPPHQNGAPVPWSSTFRSPHGNSVQHNAPTANTNPSTSTSRQEHSTNVHQELARLQATIDSLSKRLERMEEEMRLQDKISETSGQDQSRSVLRNKQLLTAITTEQVCRCEFLYII